ncbi:MAG: hypothetical protein RLZZ67_218 [Candidatus Parcubacteria bacterium]
MNLTYLIQTLQNKITTLNNAKVQAFSMGDINMVESIEKDLIDTQNTFSQLTMLVSLNQAAESANSTPAEVVAIGLDAVQNEIQGPSASAVVNGYDISAYATDPQHEQKIQTIVNGIPTLDLVTDIDTYIQSKASGSPVTGNMVVSSAGKFNVNIPLLLAIIQNDSAFGTLGVGARTFNPGNVGNTGMNEVNFGSWEAGVDAVAEWLAAHRIFVPSELVTPVVTGEDTPPVVETNTETETESEPETISVPEVEEAEVPEEPTVETPVVAPEVPVSVPEPLVTASTTPEFVPEPLVTASTTPEFVPENATTTTTVASTTPETIPPELVLTTPPPLVSEEISTTTATVATTTESN